jgi:glycosyltransferase involved in cell wall biosynthesis
VLVRGRNKRINLVNPLRICILPRLSGVGGMVSFQARLAEGLSRRGVQVCSRLDDRPYSAVLVIGGTRQVAGLWRARRQGARIVQRLDGMNWLHRLRRTGLRHYLRAEYGNLLLAFIRARLADAVVYQSEFSRSWWERRRGPTGVPNTVVYNGVDLNVFSDLGSQSRPADRFRLLLVEGNLMGGYEAGLEVALELAKRLSERLKSAKRKIAQQEIELMVVGRVAPEVRRRWEGQSPVPVQWTGLVEGERIPEIDRSAHLLYSADVNPACPNAVIEALACGLPVVAFDTGALPELVIGDAGRLAPYGGDPWRLDPPDVPALAEAALELLADLPHYRQAARARAEAAFGLDSIVDGYLKALLD